MDTIILEKYAEGFRLACDEMGIDPFALMKVADRSNSVNKYLIPIIEKLRGMGDIKKSTGALVGSHIAGIPAAGLGAEVGGLSGLGVGLIRALMPGSPGMRIRRLLNSTLMGTGIGAVSFGVPAHIAGGRTGYRVTDLFNKLKGSAADYLDFVVARHGK